MEWISVDDKLPTDTQKVLIAVRGSNIQCATFHKGKTKEQVAETHMMCGSDEYGNNLRPFRWYADGGPMSWFGQDVTHWMPLPVPPCK